jgi:hypothetical protein
MLLGILNLFGESEKVLRTETPKRKNLENSLKRRIGFEESLFNRKEKLIRFRLIK